MNKFNQWGGKRHGAGRPKSQNPTVQLSFRLPTELATGLRMAALKNGTTISEILRKIISEKI